MKGENEVLARISELHQHYDPLQYVLIFPFGDPGWNINIRNYDPEALQSDVVEAPEDQVDRNNAEISVMQYYSSRLMIRQGSNSIGIKSEQVGIHLVNYFINMS